MPQPQLAIPSAQEGRVALAIQAIKQGHIHSIRAAAASYDITYATLYNRIHGMLSRHLFPTHANLPLKRS